MKEDFNFDNVYNYIENQIKKDNMSFYPYHNYELHLIGNSEIILKKEGYTLSKITKEKGIFSLPKREKDNVEMVKKTNQLFLEILVLAGKDFNE